MKKAVCLMLTFLLTVSLFSACARQPEETTQPEVKHVLQVGYGRMDISPTESVPLSGFSNGLDRMSTEVSDPLYATCIAFTDETGKTVLLYHLDLGNSYSLQILKARNEVSDATGIPFDQILVSATHNHTAPHLGTDHPSMTRYLEMLYEQMVKAAEAALADRKDAKMYINSVYPESLNFIRHYIMDDGTYTGWQSTADKGTVIGHVAPADSQLQLLKFVRDGGKDIILANWQSHPHRGSSSTGTKVTADIVGSMRDKLEAELGCQFAYFTGASGNINPRSLIPAENVTKNYIEQGQALAQYAIDGKDGYTEAAFDGLTLLKKSHAATLKDSKYTSDITVYAFSLGEVAFVTAPYEMFCESGLAIKKDSPFKSTFVVTCSNASLGYLPVRYAFDYDAYEPSITNFAPGTAEEMVEVFGAMLKELSKN